MRDYVPDDPESEEIVLELPKQGITLRNFLEYDFDSNFLDATDPFSFTFAADRFGDEARNELRTALRPGSEVALKLAGTTIGSGYITALEVSAARGSGSEWRLEGKDKLGFAVDACADPTITFKPGQTLLDALKILFGPFGWRNDEHFDADGLADRDVKQNVQGKRRRVTKRPPKKLTSYELHQLHPHTSEGLFDFAARIANRQGLWIWPSADGKQLVVSRPDFDSPPLQKIFRDSRGNTNVLDGSVRLDINDQPTIIIADGFSGGGDFVPRNPIQAAMTNTSVYTDDTTFVNLKQRFPGCRVLDTHNYDLAAIFTPFHRPLFLHDNDAQTQKQLEYFIRRQMARLQIRSLGARYNAEGHGQSTPDGFVIWSTNSLVDVHDEIGYLNEPLYVLGRKFSKSRAGGTKTALQLVRRYTIDFGGDAAIPNDAQGDF